MPNEKNLETIPVGPLGIVALESCKELGDKVNSYIVDWRKNRVNEHKDSIAFAGYEKDSYLVNAQVQDLVQVKLRVSSTTRFVVMTYSLCWMCVTTL